MRHKAIKRRADDAQRGIGSRTSNGMRRVACCRLQQGDRAARPRANPPRCRARRSGCSAQTPGCGAHRSRHAPAHGMLERHQHAEIPAGSVDRADERDKRDEHRMLDSAGKAMPVTAIRQAPAISNGRRSWRGAIQPVISVNSAVPSSDAVARRCRRRWRRNPARSCRPAG